MQSSALSRISTQCPFSSTPINEFLRDPSPPILSSIFQLNKEVLCFQRALKVALYLFFLKNRSKFFICAVHAPHPSFAGSPETEELCLIRSRLNAHCFCSSARMTDRSFPVVRFLRSSRVAVHEPNSLLKGRRRRKLDYRRW